MSFHQAENKINEYCVFQVFIFTEIYFYLRKNKNKYV